MTLPIHRTSLVQQLHDAEGRGYGPAAWTLRRVLDYVGEAERDGANAVAPLPPRDLYLPATLTHGDPRDA